jgi:protein-arginine kinase activator protein McsA
MRRKKGRRMIDLINKIVSHMCYRCGEDEYTRGINHDCDNCILSDVIEEIRSINDRPQGEWTYLSGSKGSYMTISCPICGSTFDNVAEWKYRYCPNCGKRMDMEERR